jgi:hypothetical protein
VTEPFHELGREANNELAGKFEDQLAAMSRTLGWKLIARNIDAFVSHQGQSQSRGYDLLLAIHDPQLNRRCGCVLEAKRHEAPAYAEAVSEVQTLHDKIARLNSSSVFWENASIRKELDPPLSHGLLCHRTLHFAPDRAQQRRVSAQLRNRKHAAPVPIVQFLGPDVLEALAHIDRQHQPRLWLWPPMRRHDRAWGKACSPWSLIGGMAAFRGADGAERLWLHDTLAHGDAELITQILGDWGINPIELICTRLRPETWRILAADWARVAEQTAGREHGRLPLMVKPVLLSENLTSFDETWPVAA